jgi:hypothetical protein
MQNKGCHMWPVISSEDVSPFQTHPGNVLLWYLQQTKMRACSGQRQLQRMPTARETTHHTALGGMCDWLRTERATKPGIPVTLRTGYGRWQTLLLWG